MHSYLCFSWYAISYSKVDWSNYFRQICTALLTWYTHYEPHIVVSHVFRTTRMWLCSTCSPHFLSITLQQINPNVSVRSYKLVWCLQGSPIQWSCIQGVIQQMFSCYIETANLYAPHAGRWLSQRTRRLQARPGFTLRWAALIPWKMTIIRSLGY